MRLLRHFMPLALAFSTFGCSGDENAGVDSAPFPTKVVALAGDALYSYELRDDGTLTQLTRGVPVGGVSAGVMRSDPHELLYVATRDDTTEDSPLFVSPFVVGPLGRLTPLPRLGPFDPARIAFAAADDGLYVVAGGANLQQDMISYRFDDQSRRFRQVGEPLEGVASAYTHTNAMSMVDLDAVFTAVGAEHLVNGFAIDLDRRATGPLVGSPKIADRNVSDIKVDPNGNYLAVAYSDNRNISQVLTYQLGPDEIGRATPALDVGSRSGLAFLAISPGGGFVYVVNNGNFSEVHTFRVDSGSGNLTHVGAGGVDLGSHLGIEDFEVDPSGRFMVIPKPDGIEVRAINADGTVGSVVSHQALAGTAELEIFR